MLFYLVSKEHSYTINAYLSSWGKDLNSQIRPLPYEELFQAKAIPTGTYIFSDIERLNPKQAEIASRVWKALSEAGKAVCLLNHPTRSMRRYELLRTLYERGYNKFNLYRLTECRMPQHFPVFVRGENDHAGSLTSLLQTPEELESAIQIIMNKGLIRENKVIIEFCDTSNERGIYRKYSAFIVGENILPRHVFFSHNWMVKQPDLTHEEMLLEEQHYLETNPHAAQLKEIFQLARIDYGRIDYGVFNGDIQVWEINTNPITLWEINRDRDRINTKRLELHEHFARQFSSAFKDLMLMPVG